MCSRLWIGICLACFSFAYQHTESTSLPSCVRSIVVIRHGRIVAEGTFMELRTRGFDFAEITSRRDEQKQATLASGEQKHDPAKTDRAPPPRLSSVPSGLPSSGPASPPSMSSPSPSSSFSSSLPSSSSAEQLAAI